MSIEDPVITGHDGPCSDKCNRNPMEWKKEFLEKYAKFDSRGAECAHTPCYRMQAVDSVEIESFISSLLASQRRGVLEAAAKVADNHITDWAACGHTCRIISKEIRALNNAEEKS